MRCYVAGAITGAKGYKRRFSKAKKRLEKQGWRVVLPTCLPTDCGFSHEDYLHICKAMIDRCEAVFFLQDWKESAGAVEEWQYAKSKGIRRVELE